MILYSPYYTERHNENMDGLTVVDAMVACGLDHDVLFMGETQAQRLASDIFGNQFSACLDVTFKELDEHFKTYGDMTVAQGRIQVRVGVRKHIKAFVQWTRDELRLGRNPALTPFPLAIPRPCRTQRSLINSRSPPSGRIGNQRFLITCVPYLDVMGFPLNMSAETMMRRTEMQ